MTLLDSLAPTAAHPVVFVTGAGFSAQSGIPTFRGPEGYWTVGSRVYQPQELATRSAYRSMPREVWRWYLWRRGVCRRAEPNAAHRTLVGLEHALGDAIRLVTQNVDGLHLRAGSSQGRTHEIHGNIDWMRDESTGERLPIPDGCTLADREEPLTDALWDRLTHPRTGNRCRPHILWFDEYYEESLYRSDSAVGWARRASAVVVVGTSGAAALPWHCAEGAIAAGAVLVDVNPEDGPFRDLAARYERGVVLPIDAVEGMAQLSRTLLGGRARELE